MNPSNARVLDSSRIESILGFGLPDVPMTAQASASMHAVTADNEVGTQSARRPAHASGVGTFRAMASWGQHQQNREPAQCSVNANMHIAVSAAEISAMVGGSEAIAGKGARRVTGFPRCNCEGDQKIATRWRKQAKEDTGAFIKEMYGVTPDKLDRSDRRAMKRDCAPFLPEDKLEMLVTLTGKPSKMFWTEFSGKMKSKPANNAQLPDDELLEILKSRFPRLARVKKLTGVELTPRERYTLRNTPALTRRMSDEALEILGIVLKTRTSQKSLSPQMTLTEAESFILKSFKDVSRAKDSGRIQFTGPNARKMWKYLADRYASKLPQAFLDEYAPELMPQKTGRKLGSGNRNGPVTREGRLVDKPAKTSRQGEVVKEKSDAQKQKERIARRDAKLKKQGVDPKQRKRENAERNKVAKPATPKKPALEDALVDQFENEEKNQKDSNNEVPSTIITDPEKLRRRVNTMSQKIDNKFLFGTPFEKYTDLQWALMDSIRDSISPELLQRFRQQLDAVRLKRNRATGGAYESIVGNRQLAVAHITTAWFCGEFDR